MNNNIKSQIKMLVAQTKKIEERRVEEKTKAFTTIQNFFDNPCRDTLMELLCSTSLVEGYNAYVSDIEYTDLLINLVIEHIEAAAATERTEMINLITEDFYYENYDFFARELWIRLVY